MVDSPKISVIIPTKNRVECLLRSIQSVQSQDLEVLEIIVVNDGSTDNTATIIEENYPKIKLINNEVSKGGAIARNQGVEISEGEFIAFLDSDDEWLPNHLSSKIALINSKNAEGAFGTFYLIRGQVERKIIFNANFSQEENIGNQILSAKRFDARTSTFVFRKSSFSSVKFDEKLKKHQDWDLAINFHRRYKFVKDSNPTVKMYVEHGEERMSQKLKHDSSFYFIKKNRKYIDSNNLFVFCLKQIMRSQIANQNSNFYERYILISESLKSDLTLRNKILLYLIKSKFLNVGIMYKILSPLR